MRSHRSCFPINCTFPTTKRLPQQNGRSGMAPHVFQHPGASKPNFLVPTQCQADQQCTNTNAYIVLTFAQPRHDGCLVNIFCYPNIPAMDFVPRWTRKEKTWKNTSNNTFLSQTCLKLVYVSIAFNCQVLARERQARHTSLSCQRHFGPLGRWRQVFCHPVGGPGGCCTGWTLANLATQECDGTVEKGNPR